eukprot:SAG22_NODE_3768_length_1537_cov_1.803199_2_plen_98_part_00
MTRYEDPWHCITFVSGCACVGHSNVAYLVCTPERERARVEQAGHVELTPIKLRVLARTKVTHAALVVLSIVGGVQVSEAHGCHHDNIWGTRLVLPDR